MIAAMVSAILLIVLALITAWLAFPAFRTWSERPKYRMLERNALYDATHLTERPVAALSPNPEYQRIKKEIR